MMGMSSMMMALMVAGVVALLAGLLSILFGIPVKEFSFGNTLILSGCIAACTGLILLGLSAVVAELKLIARRLSADPRSAAADARVRAALPQVASSTPQPAADAGEGGFLFGRDQSAADQTGHDLQAESRPAEAAVPAPKPKRNLLFESSKRRERERAPGERERAPGERERAAGPSAAAPDVRGQPPAPEAGDVPKASFDDAWPKTDRGRGEIPPQRRSQRAAEPSPGPAERAPPPQPARGEDQPAVTVLKSGVVDGMAYTLYSDGSIEAKLPHGTVRFGSIAELRAHIETNS
jgi:hypothetical protein